jgi:hypothetical protein
MGSKVRKFISRITRMEIFARDLWFRSQGSEFLPGIFGWITRKGLPGRSIG